MHLLLTVYGINYQLVTYFSSKIVSFCIISVNVHSLINGRKTLLRHFLLKVHSRHCVTLRWHRVYAKSQWRFNKTCSKSIYKHWHISLVSEFGLFTMERLNILKHSLSCNKELCWAMSEVATFSECFLPLHLWADILEDVGLPDNCQEM